ncbi:MAG: TRAP transporter fused permease subunit [Peptococcaceae bacterium]|nr:TRAP transporter fused permease subunit [Peptococcaceae bacterium]
MEQRRSFSPQEKVVFSLATILGFLQLWWVMVHPLTSYLQQAIHLSFMLAIIFLTKPALKRDVPVKSFSGLAVSITLALLALGVGAYQCCFWQDILLRASNPLLWDVFWGTVLLLLIMEGIRRSAGNMMCGISGFFFLYAFIKVNADFGFQDFGGALRQIIAVEFMSEQGIYNMPLQTMSSYIIIFVIFSTVLSHLGANHLFNELAHCFVGHKRGGAGKVAVIASGIMGATSGSPIANLFTTGVYTIPMMRAQGYPSRFAGAIECASSIGGQLMPPIMGAVAFMIADSVGIAYQQVLVAALLPAILYYASLLFTIDLETQKMGLETMERQSKKMLLPILKKDGVLLLPLLLLIILLAYYAAPHVAGGISILFLYGLGVLRQPKGLSWGRKVHNFSLKFIYGMDKGVISICGLASLAAGSGMVIGFMELSGLGVTLSEFLVSLANGSLFLTLLLWGFLALALGGPMPTLSAYLLVSTLAMPIFSQFGIAPVATHLFVLYFTMVGPVIPPVSILACCSASIAGGPPIQISLSTLKIASAAFIIPFVFVLRPELLMVGAWWQILLVFLSVLLGVFLFAGVVEGFSQKRLTWGGRLFQGGVAVCCFFPDWRVNVAGCMAAVWLLYQSLSAKQREVS